MAKKIIELSQIKDNCCTPASGPPLEAEMVEEAAKLFAAFSDATRLSILSLLANSEGEVCVCDITERFTLGQPTISHHLRILKEAGLVTADKRGKWVYYSLVSNRVELAKELLNKFMLNVNLLPLK